VLIGLRFSFCVYKYSDDECFVCVRKEAWLHEDSVVVVVVVFVS